jgi:hypothetical protein
VTRATARLLERASRSLQAFYPSFSKHLWFQPQAFPRNVLAVLGDFNGLRGIQIRNEGVQIF